MSQITACIDGSLESSAVCDAASWVSHKLKTPVTLLHVLEKNPQVETDMSGNIGLGSREHLLKQLTHLDAERARLALEHGRLLLEEARARIISDGVSEVETLQRHGRLSDEVLTLESATRVLVLGRQGAGHKDVAMSSLGSQIETILRSVSCPVLVTTGSFSAPRQFMVAYDGSDAAERAMQSYSHSPLLTDATCHLVMVNHDDEEHRRKLQEAADTLAKKGIEVITSHTQGDVLKTLKHYQRENDIDLMVMGAYGHSRIRQFFLGSHTRNMLSHSVIPLLLLR
ncbi:MAG: universal stress protein [Oleibacter sp.]|nr:universal stress protein [Thalassolituus sp.]